MYRFAADCYYLNFIGLHDIGETGPWRKPEAVNTRKTGADTKDLALEIGPFPIFLTWGA